MLSDGFSPDTFFSNSDPRDGGRYNRCTTEQEYSGECLPLLFGRTFDTFGKAREGNQESTCAAEYSRDP